MGWHRRALLATLLLAAIVHAQKQTNSGADPAAAQPSGGTKSRRPPKSKADAAADTSPEPSTSKSSSSSSKNSSGSGSNSSSGAETATESSSRKSRRKNSTTEATPTETSTEPSSGKSRRNRKNRTTEAPTPEPTTPSSSRKNRRKNATTVVPPEATTRCNRACRRRLKAERRRATSTTAAPTTTTSTTTTTTTPPPPPPTPVPLDAATVAYLISSNPALHVINERILLSAAYAYSDDNEVVCNFCLLQLLAAGHTMGNDLVRREIETGLQSREPGRLGEALLQLVSGAPTLSGTFAALYQKDALPKCHSQPAWRRNERCYAIERFINLRGTKVDFTQPGTTSLINSLIERASGNMITELFPPLAASSQLVFASVLVFRDTWKQRLYWQPGSFTTFYGNLSAETLIQQEYVPLLDGSSDGVIGVSLPYSQPGMRMMLFTTSDGGSVVERLRTVHYRALAGAPLTYSTVFFPRFSVWSNKYSYADLAQQMGISELFRGGLGLGDRLRMELFVQRAVVSADVDGSDSLTAAAEPVWDGAQHPTPVQVVFDRPFVCSLVHAELDVPFFTAIIRDPTRFY